jgi:hypothetical protein
MWQHWRRSFSVFGVGSSTERWLEIRKNHLSDIVESSMEGGTKFCEFWDSPVERSPRMGYTPDFSPKVSGADGREC